MASQTTNYGFKKPAGSDFYNIEDQNDNWDIADEKIKEAAEAGFDAENANPVQIGKDSVATYANTVAIGVNVNSHGASTDGNTDSCVAIGQDVAAAANAVAIGREVNTVKFGVSIGKNSVVNAVSGVAVGYAAKVAVGAPYSIYAPTAVGSITNASGDGSTAVGYMTNCSGNYSVAVGQNAKVETNAENGIAIGKDAKSGGLEDPNNGGFFNAYDSVAIGANASAYQNNSIAIGKNAKALTSNAVAIGRDSSATEADTLAIQGTADARYAIAIGSVANAYGSVAIGRYAEATGNNATALGWDAHAKGKNTIVIGRALAWQENAIAIGDNAYASKANSTVIGINAHATNLDSTAIGWNTQSLGNYSTAIGSNASAPTYSIAIGSNASATTVNTIQMGDSGITAFKCKVQVTATSDERDKADIEDIDKATEFLKAIRTITYVRNDRDAYAYPDEKLSEADKENRDKYGFTRYNKTQHKKGTKKGERRRAGVIAQEVRQAMLDVYGDDSYANLVDDNLHNFEDVPDGVESHLGVTYGNFIPFLIKAVQELDARIQELEKATGNDSKE